MDDEEEVDDDTYNDLDVDDEEEVDDDTYNDLDVDDEEEVMMILTMTWMWMMKRR